MSDADTGSVGSWSWWGSLGGLSRTRPPPLRASEKELLAAAGYTKIPGKHARWRAPDGKVIKGKERLHKVARRLSRVGPPAPITPAPSPADIYPYTYQTAGDVLRPVLTVGLLAGVRGRRAWRKLKKKKAKLRAKLPPKYAKLAAAVEKIASRYPRVGRALRFTRGNLAAAAIFLAADYGLERLLAIRRADPKLERIKITARRLPVPKLPKRPVLLPGTVPEPRVRAIPGRSAAQIPKRGTYARPTKRFIGLERIKITARRLPVPPPVPRAVPKTAAPSPWPSIISRGISAAQPYLLKLAEPRAPRTAREAWTPPQTVGQVVPLTAVQPYAVPSPAAAKCKCPRPKRKAGKPRKRRTVCYKGSYIETASGLRKRRREQIPC